MNNEIVPVRCDVEWRKSESGIVEVVLDKELGKIEARVAKILGAPTIVRRPMDEMNSALWLLIDGSRSLREIIERMDIIFSERIAPVHERVGRSIAQFIDLGLVFLLSEKQESG